MNDHGDRLLASMQANSRTAFWRVIAIISLVAVAVVSIEQFTGAGLPGAAKPRGEYIARLSVVDFVYDDWELLEIIKEVEEDKQAKALIVWIDTPGGSAVGGEEIFHALRGVAANKPVVAVMRSMATSAGYMVALGTDYIVAREGTITGSIGVLLETAEITELAEKLGINPIIIKSSPLKGAPNLLEKADPAAIASLQVMLESFYHSFVEMVAERRSFEIGQAYQLADGRVFSGKQAFELKLIDALGGEDEALQWLGEKKKIDTDLDIVDVDQKTQGIEFIEKLTETVSRKIFMSYRSSLDGLRAIWHPSL